MNDMVVLRKEDEPIDQSLLTTPPLLTILLTSALASSSLSHLFENSASPSHPGPDIHLEEMMTAPLVPEKSLTQNMMVELV